MWLRSVPLLLMLSSCAAEPPPSGGQLYAVTADPTASPHRGANTFTVRVRTLAGQAVPGATLEVLATMPAHGHEAPPPHVTDQGDGLYRVDVVFSMAGLWQLEVVARAAQGSDGKTFQYEVP